MQGLATQTSPKREFFIASASILLALVLVKSGLVEEVIEVSRGFVFLGAFIAGMFFTSILTTPLALASFIELVKVGDILPVTLSATLGAVLADAILFIFIKARLNRFAELALGRLHHSRLGRLLKYRSFRLAMPFLGIFAIASPLPDEVGIAMLGLSNVKLSTVIALSSILHFVGIFLVLIAMKALV